MTLLLLEQCEMRCDGSLQTIKHIPSFNTTVATIVNVLMILALHSANRIQKT